MSAPEKKFIYALVYDEFRTAQDLQEGPWEVPFYIGRTSDPSRRIEQHRRESRTGSEDKYAFIRSLGESNASWDLHVLLEVDADDTDPWEFWYVIEYIRKGHSLKNMRFGDFNHLTAIGIHGIARDESVKDITSLKRRLAKAPSRSLAVYASSEKVQVRAIARSIRFLRNETKTLDGGIKSRMKVYDTGEGTEEVWADASMTPDEIATSLTPRAKEEARRIFGWLTSLRSQSQ
ncbi:MAG: hypothetical protein WCA85_12820 [Paraburkholderia sp.]|uniref:hypothetical protein n=1 Tax=Paraburkholderia sp. TaxID=1926495 RepID=UPI003C455809